MNETPAQKLEGMEVSQIWGEFPDCDPSILRRTGPWNMGLPIEGARETMDRVHKVVAWLTSTKLREEVNEGGHAGVCIVVCHSGLLQLLVRTLLGTLSDITLLSTSTSAFLITEDIMAKKSKVECQWLNRVDHVFIKMGMDLGFIRAEDRRRDRSRL